MTDAPVLSGEMADELEVESHAPYMRIWAILAILTGVEWVYAYLFKDLFTLLVGGLVALALIKACMVGWYFMHLKFEKRWVYLLIVPACIMAVFLTVMLVPDMVMKPVEESPEDESWAVPVPELDRPVVRLVERVQLPSVRQVG